MSYTTINKSTDHFNTKLYTGTGSSNAITGVGFQPDWTWIKSRNITKDHMLFDAVRGVTKAFKNKSKLCRRCKRRFFNCLWNRWFYCWK